MADVPNVGTLIQSGLSLKKSPCAHKKLGENKTMGLLFFNSSLRTRVSAQKAANNLGMDMIVMNVTQDSWQIETEDGAVMDGAAAEHIKEAAAVLGAYCDVLGVRAFPSLKDRERDYQDHVIKAFIRHSGVPVVSLESAILHPLQSLADMMTIQEFKRTEKPKVVMTWAPHVRALPQAVPNSFAQWMNRADADFTIAQPKGLELNEAFSGGAKIMHDQEKALEGADFVYVKNWSSYTDYGKIGTENNWMVDRQKLKNTNGAKVMHCLPVRRNVVIADDVLDSGSSIVIQEAENRVYGAQAVLKAILESL